MFGEGPDVCEILLDIAELVEPVCCCDGLAGGTAIDCRDADPPGKAELKHRSLKSVLLRGFLIPLRGTTKNLGARGNTCCNREAWSFVISK